MTRAVIVERFQMDLVPKQEKWFLDWVLKSPKHVSHHLTAGWMAYKSLLSVYDPDDIKSSREYFGGMGAQSLMIRDLFFPEHQSVVEFSADAVEHLWDNLPLGLSVEHADSYNPATTQTADLVGLDFGDLTVYRTREGEEKRALLDRVVSRNPKAIVLTDIAGPRLHLQRARYEEILGLGACDSYESYLYALAARLEDLFGYSLVAGYYHSWSAVMALVPTFELGLLGVFDRTPEQPVGLTIL